LVVGTCTGACWIYKSGLSPPLFCASHASVWISNVICPCLIYVQWFEVRGGSSFCWYWWNCWRSPFVNVWHYPTYIYENISQTLCGNMGRIDMNTIKTLKKCNYIKKTITTGNRLRPTKQKERKKDNTHKHYNNNNNNNNNNNALFKL